MYAVHVVPDDQLPGNLRRALVQFDDGSRLLILTRTAAAEGYPVRRIDVDRLDVDEFIEDDAAVVLQEVVNGT